ncbi:MAG: DNA recombination protein RmuC [Bacteroides sp.]|nr:DNA recombination protein RmuC [Bacteroides sp.]MCM1413430.1 DNA recombination protein RmuC [Bacteroides sp.]MCM1471359.1 DNA recombination protein RmuC [Bacteroides sp.]
MIIATVILSVLFLLSITAIYILMRRLTAARISETSATEKAAALTENLRQAESASEKLQESLKLSEERIAEALAETAASREATIKAEMATEQVKQQLETERQLYAQQQETLRQQQEQLAKQTESNFRLMAGEILKQQSASLRETNDQRMGELLSPLKEEIDKFSRQVSECYSNEARERFSLQQRIKELIEANLSIGKEAKELSAALRGNSKKQGDWGELVLENILENSGLRKGHEFTVQQQSDEYGSSIRDEEGRGLRPDVIVHCPDGHAMIIDSKVSLTAFIDFVNSEDDEKREEYGRQHLASVVKHIQELSAKNYQDYIGKNKLDFVIMFIPNEAAYSAALTLEPSIWQKAYDKRVLIVSPTQLVGTLRLINQLWSHDRQTRNAIEIAEKSGQMYDKFVGFVTDMEKIEKSLNASQAAYAEAMKKLRSGRGNLISRAESLKELGIKASKKLREAEESDDQA